MTCFYIVDSTFHRLRIGSTMVNIRATASNVFRHITESRFIKTTPYLMGSRGPKPFVLSRAELLIATPLLLTYLYHFSKFDSEGSDQFTKFGLGFAEGGIAQFVVEKTKMLWPQVALGWAAINIGKAKDKLERIKIGIDTLLLFTFGYAGIRIGMGYTDQLRFSEARNMLKMSGDSLTHLADNTTHTLSQQLKTLIQTIADKAKVLDNVSKLQEPRFDLIKDYAKDLQAAQDAFKQKFASITTEQFEGQFSKEAKIALNTLSNSLNLTKLNRAIRALNPVAGYLLLIFVAHAISNFIAQRYLNDTSAGQTVEAEDRTTAPLILNQLLTPFSGSKPFTLLSQHDNHVPPMSIQAMGGAH